MTLASLTSNVLKRATAHPSLRRQPPTNSAVGSISHSLPHSLRRQQVTPCVSLFPQIQKSPRIINYAMPFNRFLIYRRSYSSSYYSNNQKKNGILAWYLRMLDQRPILTKSVSSCLIYAVADLTSQIITVPVSGSFDLIRTLRMAAFGLVILGPAQHVWFNFLGRILPKQDMITTFKKLLCGQVLFGPIITSSFFSFNAALQGESFAEIASRLKRDLFPTLINGLIYWPVCDFLTYKIIPVHLQPLMNSSFAYLWTIYLTYMASLDKAVAE